MSDVWQGTIAIIGAGQLGSSFLEGLLAAGVDPSAIEVATRNPDHAAALAERHGVSAVTPQQAARDASLLVIAVRPGQVEELLASLDGQFGDHLTVCSLTGNPDHATIAGYLPAGTPVVRAMPNTAMAVRAGLTGICPAPDCPADVADRVRELFGHLGTVIDVEESRIGLIGSLAGHGQAVTYYVADAMVQWGVMVGFSRAEAREIVAAAIAGAGASLTQTDTSPADLHHRLSTPGGSTVRAMTELDAPGVRAAVIECMDGGRYVG